MFIRSIDIGGLTSTTRVTAAIFTFISNFTSATAVTVNLMKSYISGELTITSGSILTYGFSTVLTEESQSLSKCCLIDSRSSKSFINSLFINFSSLSQFISSNHILFIISPLFITLKICW